jgi:hypothetical protein
MQGGNKRALGIVLFVVIGASALVLGILNAGKSIGGPFKSGSSANGDSLAQAEAILRSKDTDEDGLSDYDELNVTHSSAYIKDSDSDGIDDGTEANEGTDPNCPKGQNCGVPAPVIENPAGSGIDVNVNAGASVSEPSGIGGGTSLPVATPSNITQIRAYLKEQGLAEDILNSIDDQTLINMYNEALPSSAPKATQ